MVLRSPRIVCAAVRYPGGEMLVGPRHFDSVMLMQYRALRIQYEEDESEKGFVDQEGKFYTRQETQQILHRVSGDEAHGGTLFSENLY